MNPEILGLIASVIIFLSGLMQSEKKLRAVDAVGSVLMSIYGILISAPSVIILNGGLAIAHVYRLIILKKGENNAKRNAPQQPQGAGRE